MSDTTDTTATAAPDTDVDTDTAEKRERRKFPIRLMSQDANGGWHFVKDIDSFATIDAAEKWIATSGAPSAAYLMPRVIGCKRRPPTKLEDVAI